MAVHPVVGRDPNGNATAYRYYAADDHDIGKRGNLSAVVNGVGHISSIAAYDAGGRPITTIDPNGLVTTLGYDARGRLVTRQTGVESRDAGTTMPASSSR
jgi:YD repeat-containing protein